MKLKRINLRKLKGNEHPDLSTRKLYLVDVYGDLYVGRFTRQHYGLNFDCDWGASGLQLGSGPDAIRAIWEIIGRHP